MIHFIFSSTLFINCCAWHSVFKEQLCKKLPKTRVNASSAIIFSRSPKNIRIFSCNPVNKCFSYLFLYNMVPVFFKSFKYCLYMIQIKNIKFGLSVVTRYSVVRIIDAQTNRQKLDFRNQRNLKRVNPSKSQFWKYDSKA